MLAAAAAVLSLCLPTARALVTDERQTQALLEVGAALGGRVVVQWPVDLTSVQASSGSSNNVDPCGGAGNGSQAWVGIQCSYYYSGDPGLPTSASSSGLSRGSGPVYATITDLLLQGSDAAGAIPDALFELTSLRRLDLSLNPQLSGTIPTRLGRLTDLQLLDLHGCGLSGTLPAAAFAKLSVLEQLMLGSNDFTGPLPSTLSAPCLYYLDVVGNRLSGTVPPQLSACTALGHLHLSYNRFSSYPAGRLTGLSHLIHLLLDNNALVQPLPTEVSLLPRLAILHLSNNRFWGFNVSGLVRPYSGQGAPRSSNDQSNMFSKVAISGAAGTINTTTSAATAAGTAAAPSPTASSPARTGWQTRRPLSDAHSDAVPGWYRGLVDLSARNCLVSQGVQLPTALMRSPAAGQLQVLDLGGNGIEGQLTAADLTGLTQLRTLKMDRNRISGSLPHAMSALTSLMTLDLSQNALSGVVPDLSSLPTLLSANLSSNLIADASIRNLASSHLQLSLANNTVCTFKEPASNISTSAAAATSTDFIASVCQSSPEVTTLYVAGTVCPDATAVMCPPSSPEGGVFEMDPAAFRVSSTCRCTSPLLLELHLTAPQFSSYDNELADMFERTVYGNLRNDVPRLTRWQVRLKWVNETAQGSMLQQALLAFFPPANSSGFALDKDSVGAIKEAFNNHTRSKYILGPFGPYSVLAFSGPAESNYSASSWSPPSSSSPPLSTGAIVGIVVAAVLATVLVLTLVFGAIWRRRKRNYDWWKMEDYKAMEGLKVQGVQRFALKAISDATEGFGSLLGEGGYGQVYRGVLSSGETVAVKRAKPQAQQGGVEFRNEIELLSRVRHVNCVELRGYCREAGEQLLVYEFIEKGTLFDMLHVKKSKDRKVGEGGRGRDVEEAEGAVAATSASGTLDPLLLWEQRLQIALGAARGLAYLHHEIRPPIIHRDIKTANILIDSELRAKVADFGLSKLVPEDPSDKLETQVKGTLGYLDPAYYMSDLLTEKSDIYSFGIVLLEIATGLPPIQDKQHIRRIVTAQVGREGVMSVADPRLPLLLSETGNVPSSNLSNITSSSAPSSGSPGMSAGTAAAGVDPASFELLLRLAMWCSSATPSERPDMRSVVATLEECLRTTAAAAGAAASAAGASAGGVAVASVGDPRHTLTPDSGSAGPPSGSHGSSRPAASGSATLGWGGVAGSSAANPCGPSSVPSSITSQEAPWDVVRRTEAPWEDGVGFSERESTMWTSNLSGSSFPSGYTSRGHNGGVQTSGNMDASWTSHGQSDVIPR